MSKVNTDGGAMVKLELKKLWGITRMESCSYSLVWTSRPVLSGKKNYELYPSDFMMKPLKNEEFNRFSRFLDNSRALFERYNVGIKEYFF